MAYEVIFSPEAQDHLRKLPARVRTLVYHQTLLHLSHEPSRTTRRRKLMAPNHFAEWELRLGDFRVYYNVDTGADPHEYLVAVARKVRDRVFLGDEEIMLEDS
jgi:mRNA-degrading endonuclease RelE of RelBE toxin-antitoxin system